MKGFKFRLQKVLDLRINREEESIIKFKKAQREKIQVQQKLDDLHASYKKYNVLAPDEDVIQKKIRLQYLEALDKNIDNTNKELDNKIKNLEDKRQELKQKQIERKTVEILKDKQKEAFIKEQNFIEQKSNDEFALYGYIRNHSKEVR